MRNFKHALLGVILLSILFITGCACAQCPNCCSVEDDGLSQAEINRPKDGNESVHPEHSEGL